MILSDWLQALILGLIQGLTEFLPISSSGHLEISKVILGLQHSENLSFTIVVHGATVLSTIIVFKNELLKLIKTFFTFNWKTEENKYIWKIILSMIPVGFVGLFMKDSIESLFTGDLLLVGSMLLITSLLLFISYYVKKGNKEISFASALIIGIAQAIAVIPGISRSGSTIATGLILGVKREEVTKFSFLMVIIPILGENILQLFKGSLNQQSDTMGALPLLIGFIVAFITGLFACKWMLAIVNKGKLIWFAVYCLLAGFIAIFFY